MEGPKNERYEACFRLFLLHNGTNLSLIEREMRALGYADFNRRILYNRNEDGKHQPGWIEKYHWRSFLDAEVTGREPHSVSASPDLRVTASKASFQAWLKAVSPEMTWDWKHQEYIYRHLERVTSGESKRLMIFLPPRHGKSELVTVRYAGWRLWNDPKMRIIVSSYNQQLADKFSRSIRRLLSTEEDKLIRNHEERVQSAECGMRKEEAPSGSSDTRVRQCTCGRCGHEDPELGIPNSAIPRMFPRSRTVNSVGQWETAVGGGVRAAGVGAGVTGFGAQLIIIDDPVKNRADAESERLREKAWDWYRNDLYTRLEPNGSIVLIQTRWHEDDLAGRLLLDMQNGGDQWEVINLPALAEEFATAETQRRRDGEEGSECERAGSEDREVPDDDQNSAPRLGVSAVKSSLDPLGREEGAALWPERFDETSLDEIKRLLGGYSFSALYQQRPTPAEGGIFKRAWFTRFVDRAPEGLKWKRGYDLAISTKTSACYTSSFRVAYDSDGNLYIADGFRKRIEFPEQRRYIISRLKDERDTEHGIEKALHGEAIIQEVRTDPAARGANLRGVTASNDKLTRALKWAPLAEEGKVILVRGHWNQEFLDEVCKFPGGHFDDQVDAVSLAVAMFQEKNKKLFVF